MDPIAPRRCIRLGRGRQQIQGAVVVLLQNRVIGKLDVGRIPEADPRSLARGEFAGDRRRGRPADVGERCRRVAGAVVVAHDAAHERNRGSRRQGEPERASADGAGGSHNANRDPNLMRVVSTDRRGAVGSDVAVENAAR